MLPYAPPDVLKITSDRYLNRHADHRRRHGEIWPVKTLHVLNNAEPLRTGRSIYLSLLHLNPSFVLILFSRFEGKEKTADLFVAPTTHLKINLGHARESDRFYNKFNVHCVRSGFRPFQRADRLGIPLFRSIFALCASCINFSDRSLEQNTARFTILEKPVLTVCSRDRAAKCR